MIAQQQAPRRTDPIVPVNDQRFVWSPHGNVQAVWRRFGWVPPSEQKATPEKNISATSQL